MTAFVPVVSCLHTVEHIAAGRLVLQGGDARGVELREATRAERAHFRPRPSPILQRPRLIRGLLDRRTEIAAALSALDAAVTVEVCGGPGTGKTALLRHLAHHPRADAFADGVVYLSARSRSPIDLLQALFDAFYESDTICKPTDAEIRRALQDKQSLILLDGVTLPQKDLEHVLDAAPRCAFVVAARDRCLWGEVRSLMLTGLPADEAVLLLERELERELTAAERTAAAALCTALDGHPLRIQQAAAIVRERACSLAAWTQHVAPDGVLADLMTSIDDRERRVLLALSALAGVPIELQHVSGIAEVTDTESSLNALVRRRLVLNSRSRYQLADGVVDRLRRTEDLKPWVNRAITYFTAWAERNRRHQETLLEASEAILRVQEHAAASHRWGEALRLGRLLESALIVHARWGDWGDLLERCLAAAKGTSDRSVEAWALHQIGTRAVCLGDAATARRVLTEAARIRGSLGENAAAAISRRNLEFIVTAVPEEEARSQPAMPFEHAWDSDSLPLHDTAVGVMPTHPFTGVGVMLTTFLLCAILGGVMYTHLADKRAGSQEPPIAESAAATSVSPPARRTVEPAPAAPSTPPRVDRANILIFTARPGSITTRRPTDLCYAVKEAVETRIEPGIGSVDSAGTLTCRRVAPARTTTYELTTVGRDGIPVSQQVVIVVK